MENNPPMRNIPGFAHTKDIYGNDRVAISSNGYQGIDIGGSSGGGGGDGGGSGKWKAPKRYKEERYHYLTKQIEIVSDRISDLTSALDKAFGK
jgi:hypothetical protein